MSSFDPSALVTDESLADHKLYLNHLKARAREATIERLVSFLKEWAEENGKGSLAYSEQVDDKAFRRRAGSIFEYVCKYSAMLLGENAKREFPNCSPTHAGSHHVAAGSTPRKNICNTYDFPAPHQYESFLHRAINGSDIYTHPQYLLNFSSENLSLMPLLLKTDDFQELFPGNACTSVDSNEVPYRDPLDVATQSFPRPPVQPFEITFSETVNDIVARYRSQRPADVRQRVDERELTV